MNKNEKKVAIATNDTKTNAKTTDLIFSLRGSNSYSDILRKYKLKQLTNRSNDATQLILSGKSSINLRKKQCFINATKIDFALFSKCDFVTCVENDNSVDNIRPNRIYFDLSVLDKVCAILAKNSFNLNGFELN